jgi:tetratricopeptide (TPR) repeat protein
MALQREQIVQTAEKFVSRGKIEPAIKEYRKLLAENPNDINTLNRVGDLYARIQRIDEAVDFFTQIAEQYTAEGFFVKAIAIYKKIIKLDPTRLEVYEQLAELYHRQGLVTEARTQYQVLADYYQKHANAPSAIAIYQKMVQLEPDNPTYHVKLAEIYHQQQLVEKAMGEYRLIAELMIKHGRPQEAAQVYERALDIESQNIPFITDAVLKLREAGNNAGAAHFLAIAVERNPHAEKVARMVRDDSVPAAPRPEARPEPLPEARFGSVSDVELEIEEEPAVDLSFDDDLSRAMAEAAAAVSGDESYGAAVAEPDAESDEIELDLEDMFEIELPDEDEEPTSLVKPPADLLEAPRRPAWAQETPPAAVTGDETVFMGRAMPPEPVTPAEPEEMEMDLSSLEDLELDMELDSVATPGGAGGMAEDPLDRTGIGLREPEPAEDLVTEAEVLAKYGLEDKAVERLEEALRLHGDHLSAYALLIQLHGDKGRHGKALELANRMSAAAAGREPWGKVRKRLLAAGYRLDGDRVIAGPDGATSDTVPAPPAAPAEEEAPPVAAAPIAPIAPIAPMTPMAPIVEPAPELGLEDFSLPELADVPPPAPASPPPSAVAPPPVQAPPRPAAAPKAAKADRVDELLRGFLSSTKPSTPRAPAAPLPQTPPPAPPQAEAAPPVAATTPAPSSLTPPAPPPAFRGTPPAGVFNPLQIGELVESLDIDDEGSYSSVAHDSAADLFADLPPLPPTQALSSGVNHAALDDTGTSWLDEPAEPEPTSAAELFADEEDFFDLAGELVEELSKEEVFQRDGMLVQSEQTLEEIVEGFKKGVAEHLSPTDYDTHFNLGIAYREMGLLDEAVGEFQLASKDARYLVLCCSMLGLCFVDKGLPELAIKWYRRALEHPGISGDDSLGMMYDLGNVYMSMGDDATAYKTFVDLYGIDTSYRDVVAKLEELGRPR